MNEYEQQAQDFLTATETALTVEYQYTGPYFPDDKEKRDIYRFTLTNKRGQYSATYGDSIHNTERRAWAKHNGGWPIDRDPEARRLGVKTRRQALEWRNHKPGACNILACLSGYDPGTFEDFCSDYGYDTDSRKAVDLYFRVQEEYNGLRRLFTGEQLEQLADIQ